MPTLPHTAHRQPSPPRSGTLDHMIWFMVLVIVATVCAPLLWSREPPSYELPLVIELHVLRTAVSCYWVQHQQYPGQDGPEQFIEQLVEKSNRQGATGAGPGFDYGPYLRGHVLPENPVERNNDVRVVDGMPDEPVGVEAWIYCRRTGEIRANSRSLQPGGARYFDL